MRMLRVFVLGALLGGATVNAVVGLEEGLVLGPESYVESKVEASGFIESLPADTKPKLYKCKVLRVIDGDTIDCEVDLGFSVALATRFRLAEIDASEQRTTEGEKAKARLLELAPEGSELFVATNMDRREKFGRVLGVFQSQSGENINLKLLSEGHAVPYP